jgi:hypothetical protein
MNINSYERMGDLLSSGLPLVHTVDVPRGGKIATYFHVAGMDFNINRLI